MRYLHTMIRATDLDKTLLFFVDHLGLQEVRRYDSEGRPVYPRVSRRTRRYR